jgi:predicted choloylglycine hydrolase
MRRFTVLLLLIAGLGCAEAPSQSDVVRLSAAAPTQLEKPFALPIVVLKGTSENLGEAHAQQLSAPIHILHEKYLTVFVKNQMQKYMAIAAAKLFENQLLPQHQAEVAALARGTDIDENETMLGQCFLDLSRMTACSTMTFPADASPDHIARFGRNLDFFSLGVADKYTTLFIVKPSDGRYAFASVGWPGMIGVLSGMNEHGLSLANMEVTREPRLPQAMPYTLLYRTILEQCRTVDEAIALLQTTPIQTANNLMLMDAAGNRAVAELSPDTGVHVRRGMSDKVLISTNHQRDQDQDTPGRCWRYDYIHQTAAGEFGHVNLRAIQAMLAHTGSNFTLQSMIFEPANRVIYVAAGTNAAHKEFSRLDLRPYFAAR